jgi:hypothetical protein
MTPNIGAFATNLQNLYMFSNCSINNFKTKFLSADKSLVELNNLFFIPIGRLF